MKTNHTKNESRLTCHQVHPECDVYHPDGHPIKNETPTPDAKTVADKLTSIMFVEGYVGKENLEAVNFLLNKTLTNLQANAEREKRELVEEIINLPDFHSLVGLAHPYAESLPEGDRITHFCQVTNQLHKAVKTIATKHGVNLE